MLLHTFEVLTDRYQGPKWKIVNVIYFTVCNVALVTDWAFN